MCQAVKSQTESYPMTSLCVASLPVARVSLVLGAPLSQCLIEWQLISHFPLSHSVVPLLRESIGILMQRTPPSLDHALPECYQRVSRFHLLDPVLHVWLLAWLDRVSG